MWIVTEKIGVGVLPHLSALPHPTLRPRPRLWVAKPRPRPRRGMQDQDLYLGSLDQDKEPRTRVLKQTSVHPREQRL